MDRILLLGVTLGTIFAISMVTSPVLSGSITDFTAKTKSDVNSLHTQITTTTNIPTNGGTAFGYGVLTRESSLNAILVATTHGGFMESIEQYGSDDPKWHTHYITLTDDGDENNECPGLEISDISYGAPGDVAVSGENVVFDGSKSFNSFNPFNSSENSFVSGKTPVAVISFDMTPVLDGDKVTNLCIAVNGLYPTK